jgi:hypothetical protein
MARSPLKTKRVRWSKAYRIISSIFPPIDLFEDTSAPEDWELLASLEAKSNPRIVEVIGQLSLVPPERRVSGPGASYVMAPFTHISPNWAGRFHDGTFGAYYAAKKAETALAETMHHRSEIYRASRETPGWFSQYRELIGRVDHSFHNLTERKDHAECLAPDDYVASQSLARDLRQNGSSGILYPSVRHEGGLCLAAFWPDVIGIPVQGRHFAYHFNGEFIDMYRDETSGEVFKIIR